MKSAEVAVWTTALLSLAIALAFSILVAGTGHVGILLALTLFGLSYRMTFLAGRSGKKFQWVADDPYPEYSRLDRLDGLGGDQK